MKAGGTRTDPSIVSPTTTALGIAVLVVLTALALGVSGHPVGGLVPAMILVLIIALLRLPLRTTVVLLAFLALVLENPAELPASGAWKSPLYTLGALLLTNLNTTLPIRALRFSGLDVVLAILIGNLLWDLMREGSLAGEGSYQTPRALGVAALLSITTAFLLIGYGKVRGGDFTQMLWQAQKLVYMPLVFLLFQAAIRGPRDWRLIGSGLVIAALLRSLLAMWVRYGLKFDIEAAPHATTHGDSMLFASATLLLLVAVLEHPFRATWMTAGLCLPILFGGMLANNRRLVWVEIALAALVVLIIARRKKVKRAVLRGAAVCLPVAVLYLAAGWNSGSAVFAPARTVKSLVSSEADRSTLSRDVENYNLAITAKLNPLLGTGFGHEYVEMILADDISSIFPQYRFIPHNSVLGLWAQGGLLGFTGLWLVLVLGVFFAARAYRVALTPSDRVASLVVISIIFIFVLHAYGDMGIISWTGVFLVAPALAVSGKLARSTGAWPARNPEMAHIMRMEGESR